MTTPAVPPVPPAPPTSNPSPSVPPVAAAPSPTPAPSPVKAAEAAAAVETVVSDLHQTAVDFKAEFAAASDKTKADLQALLRDASIARGEAFTALRKLLG